MSGSCYGNLLVAKVLKERIDCGLEKRLKAGAKKMDTHRYNMQLEAAVQADILKREIAMQYYNHKQSQCSTCTCTYTSWDPLPDFQYAANVLVCRSQHVHVYVHASNLGINCPLFLPE